MRKSLPASDGDGTQGDKHAGKGDALPALLGAQESKAIIHKLAAQRKLETKAVSTRRKGWAMRIGGQKSGRSSGKSAKGSKVASSLSWRSTDQSKRLISLTASGSE